MPRLRASFTTPSTCSSLLFPKLAAARPPVFGGKPGRRHEHVVRPQKEKLCIAAVKRRLGQPQQAITQLKRVLSLSDQIGNHAGDIDALGTIADLYAEMDDYEMAAKYYDMYIEGMTSDKFEKVDEPSTTESMR